MEIILTKESKNYMIMPNYYLKEKDMSLDAKGLLGLMLSLPDNWDYSINNLASLCKESKDSVAKVLRELEKFKYIVRTKLIDDNGRFKGYNYTIYEKPFTSQEEKEC